MCSNSDAVTASNLHLSFLKKILFFKSQVIINCVCAPDQSLNAVGAFAIAPLRPLCPQQPPIAHNRVLAHMWQVVQNNNGIKVSSERYTTVV